MIFFVVTFINWWLKGLHLQALVLPAPCQLNGSFDRCLLTLPFLCAPVKVMKVYKPEDFFKMFGYVVRFEAFLLFIWLGCFFTGLRNTSFRHTSVMPPRSYLDNFFDLEE